MRLLGQAVAHAGNEGAVELGKLESLFAALQVEGESPRRTLAGAMITLKPDEIVIERAPPRRRPAGGSGPLTTGKTQSVERLRAR